MKFLLRASVAAVALAGFVGPSIAADMVDMPTSYWNGFYIGGQGGYYDGTEKIPGPIDYNAGDGVSLGGYVGYNMELSPNFVIGIEGDYNWGLGESGFPGLSFTNVDSFGSIRGRLGYAMDRTLLYITGGVAFADVGLGFGPCPGCYDNPAVGFAVGGGIEHFLTESISMKAEYVYMGFDDYFVDPAYSLEVHSIRGGVAFHF